MENYINTFLPYLKYGRNSMMFITYEFNLMNNLYLFVRKKLLMLLSFFSQKYF